MPNHITNRLSISGEIADKKRAYAALIGNYGRLDFNTMVPMPKSLNIPSSGFVESLALALKGKVDAYSRYNSPEEVFSEFKKTLTNVAYQQTLRHAKQHNKNIDLYGCADWYGWCRNNWGTKWNAYDQVLPFKLSYPKNRFEHKGKKNVDKPLNIYLHRISKKRLHALFNQDSLSSPEMIFNTAWSTPEPVIKAFSKRFPSLVIKVRFADEDIGSNCGEYHYQNSKIIYQNVSPRWNEMDEAMKKEWRKFAVLTIDPDAISPEYLRKNWSMDPDYSYLDDEDE